MPFNLSYDPWADEAVESDEAFDLSYDPWADEPVLGDESFDLSYDPWADTAADDRYTTYNNLLGKDGYIAQAADRGEISIGEEGDDRPGHFWQGLGSFISQVPSIATDVMPMTAYRAYRRGKDVTLEDETGIDRLIRKNIQERAKYKKLSEEERQKKWFRANIPFTNIGIDINLAQAEDVADSLGYSVVNAFATLLGRAVGRGVGATTGPAAPVATPALGVAAGFASGYYVASGATRDEFVERARDAYLKEVGDKVTPETEAGWQARYEMIKSDADWTGFWEAAPETVGNLLMFGIAKLPIKGAVAKIGLAGAVNKLKNEAVRKIGKELINKVGIPAAKLMGMLTEETFTEAITTMKQSEIEYKNGMRDKPLSYLESIVEVLPTVLLTTPILGLGMGGAVKILEKTTGKIVEEKDKKKLTEFVDEMVTKLPREEVAVIREQALKSDPKHPIIDLIDKAVKTIPPPLPPAKKAVSEAEVLERGKLARKESVIKTLEVTDQEAVRALGREHGLTDAEMDDRSIDEVISMVADKVVAVAPAVKGQGGGIDVLETAISGIDKTFEPGTVKEALTNATRTQAQNIASAMGAQVTFFEYDGKGKLASINGLYDAESNRIFINSKAKNPVLKVFGHEAWHQLKELHPDLYKNVLSVARGSKKLFNEFIADINKRRASIGQKDLKPGDLTEEYFADFAGDMFSKASFWKAINKSNPTFARKIAASLRKIIQDFRRLIAAKPELKKTKQPFENMDQVEAAMAEVFGKIIPKEAKKPAAEKAKFEIKKPEKWTDLKVESLATAGLPGSYAVFGTDATGARQSISAALSKTKAEAELKKFERPTKGIKLDIKTPEFKKWFGKSKVVDKKGEPVTVYHGTTAKEDFDIFQPGDMDVGIHFGTKGQANDRIDYIVRDRQTVKPGMRIIPAYLSIQKPFVLKTDPGLFNADNLPWALKQTGKFTPKEISDLEAYEIQIEEAARHDLAAIEAVEAEFRDAAHVLLRKHGYDGIKYLNTGEIEGMTELMKRLGDATGKEKSEIFKEKKELEKTGADWSWVAFEPNQIKSIWTTKPSAAEPKFEIRAYTGTAAAKFEEFDTGFIGSGEGALAFGWGLYFTDVFKIAKWYANRLSGMQGVKYGRKFVPQRLDPTPLSFKLFGETLIENGKHVVDMDWPFVKYTPMIAQFQDNNYQMYDARAAIMNRLHFNNVGPGFFRENVSTYAALAGEAGFIARKRGLKAIQGIFDWVLRNAKHDLKHAVKGAENLRNGIKWLKSHRPNSLKDLEVVQQLKNKQVIKVTLHKGKQPGDYTWLDWYDTVPQDIADVVNYNWKQEGRKGVLISRKPGSKFVLNGGDLYKVITEKFATDTGQFGRFGVEAKKEASLFLLRSRIDGVRFPTMTLSGKPRRDRKAFNYVVFDPSAITIEDRLFMQKKLLPAKEPAKEPAKVAIKELLKRETREPTDAEREHLAKVKIATTKVMTLAKNAMPTDIINDVSDLVTLKIDYSRVLKQIQETKVLGVHVAVGAFWDHKNDRVVLIANQFASVKEAMGAWLHEQIGHKGIEDLFASKKIEFNEFLDAVYDVAGSTKLWLDLAVLYSPETLKMSAEEGRRYITKEFLAKKAEQLSPGKLKQIYQLFRDFINKWFEMAFGIREKQQLDLFQRKEKIVELKDIPVILEAAKRFVYEGQLREFEETKFTDQEYTDFAKLVYEEAPRLITWYTNHNDLLNEKLGKDAPIFNAILALTSIAGRVEVNSVFAVQTYLYLTGRRDMPGGRFPNMILPKVEALARGELKKLQGKQVKIQEMARALLGDPKATVNDRWMYRLFFGDPMWTRGAIEAAAAGEGWAKRLAELASSWSVSENVTGRHKINIVTEMLTKQTDRNWKPQEVQAALWSYWKSKGEGIPLGQVADYYTGLSKPSAKLGGLTPMAYLEKEMKKPSKYNINTGQLHKTIKLPEKLYEDVSQLERMYVDYIEKRPTIKLSIKKKVEALEGLPVAKALGMGVHFRNTILEKGEFLLSSDRDGKIEPSGYSRSDIGMRLAAHTGKNPYAPLVYFYEAGTRPEHQIASTKRRVYNVDFSSLNIYDAVKDPLKFKDEVRKRLESDPWASSTNILANLIKAEGYGGFLENSPYGNGRWVLVFKRVAVNYVPTEVDIAISDVVEGIEKIPQSIAELNKILGKRASSFYGRIAGVLGRYQEIREVTYKPSISQFVEATADQLEIGGIVSAMGPLPAVRAFAAELGIENSQRQVYVMSTEGEHNGRMFRFKVKKDIESVVEVAEKFNDAGLTEFNIVVNREASGIWVEQFVYNAEDFINNETLEKMSNLFIDIADIGYPGNKEYGVNSELLGAEGVDEKKALANYKKHIVKYYGKEKGEEVYAEAKQKRGEYRKALRSGGALQPTTQEKGYEVKKGEAVEEGVRESDLKKIQEFKETKFKDSDEIMSFIENNFHDKPAKEPKLEIKAYHGSGTVFEEFDTGYVGTGEGAGAFGWGIYFSSIEEIGKHYGKAMRPKGVYLGGKKYELKQKMTGAILNFLRGQGVDDILQAGMKEALDRGTNAQHIETHQDYMDAYDELREMKKARKKVTFEKAQLYKVTLHKDKKPGDYEWLDWYGELSDKQINKIFSQLRKEPKKITLPLDVGIRAEKAIFKVGKKGTYLESEEPTGGETYGRLLGLFGSKKEASLFLLRAGIDGIRYPTETLSGRLGKGLNYVVFDDAAISIEDRVSFSLRGPELSPIGKQYMETFLGKQGEEAPVARSRIRGLLYPWKYVTGKSLASGETIGEVLIRKTQNKYIHLKKLQKRLSPTTSLEDKIDVYLAEEIFSGRTAWQLDQFEANYVKPFLDKMLELGIDVKDLDLYTYAAHAPERNARIDKKNPDFREKGIPGSGMHTEVANTIIKRYREKGMLGKLEGLAKILYKINGARIKLLLNAGLITKDQHDAILGTYKRYVPLRGKEGEPDFMGSGRGFSTPSTGLQRALGRKSFAQSPLAWSLGAVEETIVKINKNEVGKALTGLIRTYPDKDLWTIDEITTKQKWDPDKGEVETVRVPAWAQKDVLHVWEDGKRRNVKIKDPLLEKALLNIGSEKMGAIVATLARFNRYLAMVNTSLNPEFVLTNFARDIQTAGINLTAEQSSKLMRKVMKDVPKALRHAYRGYRGKPGLGDWGKWFKLYRSSGGSIGFFGLRGIDDKIKAIDAMIGRTKKGVLPAARRGVSEITGFISDVNSAVENAVRLASFKNAVESGMTPARAASLSKNLTVNFNRKGELGAFMNAFYLFYNAGVQGTARVFQVMTSKTGRRIGAGIAATAFMWTEMNRMAGGDDEEDGRNYYDKIPNYVKERSMILMLPGTEGKYIRFPLPYGYNVFWAVGEQVNSSLHSGKPVQGAINVLNTAIDAFNPMGGDSTLIRTLSPTLADIPLDLYMNQNFAGYPIKPEQSQFGLPKPQSWLYWRSVSPISKYIAQKVNKLTKGNPIRPGKIDVSPEVMDYLVGTFTGAAGAFINRSLNLGMDLLTGKEVPIHKTPFQRVFMGEQTEFYAGAEYRKAAEEIKRRIAEEEMGPPAIAPELSPELRSRYEATEKNLRSIRKRIKEIERSQLSAKRKKELVDEKRKQILLRQKGVIKEFDKEIGGSPWELKDILNLRTARKKANG